MPVEIIVRYTPENGTPVEWPLAEAETLYDGLGEQLGRVRGVLPVQEPPAASVPASDAVQSVEVPPTLRVPSLKLQGPPEEVPAG